jgi:hypothetical protein
MCKCTEAEIVPSFQPTYFHSCQKLLIPFITINYNHPLLHRDGYLFIPSSQEVHSLTTLSRCNILWHVNPLLGYTTEVTQPASKHLATKYMLHNNRGSGVFSMPCHAERHLMVPTQHATMTSHGTRSRGISRDLCVSTSDVTHPSPGPLLQYGSVNTPSRQQWHLYDRGFYKRNWNV